MQSLHEADHQFWPGGSETSRVTLQYPTLPLDDKVASWLSHSRPTPMASQADDSSVDDNLSSVGESSWDIIDGASITASDDEDHSLSRQSTPSSDSQERSGPQNAVQELETGHEVHREESSPSHFMSNEDRTDNHASIRESSAATSRLIQEHDEDLESTRKSLGTGSAPSTPEPLRFHESKVPIAQEQELVEVSHFVRLFEGPEHCRIAEEFYLNPVPEVLVGTVRQKMNTDSLRPLEPYKIFFVGPSSIKDRIVQKIADALASPARSQGAASEVAENRFTVAPISGFGDTSCVEVVLMNSLGLDIIVEECTSAQVIHRKAHQSSICVQINGNKSICSAWDEDRDTFVVPEDYKLPNVAIVCLPKKWVSSARDTRLLAQSFISQLGVPVITISSDSEWKKPDQVLMMDNRTPHFCLESRSSKVQGQEILRRLPINLPTFLDIDAGQLNRNLACLASPTKGLNNSRISQKQKLWGGQGLPELRVLKTVQRWALPVYRDLSREWRSILGVGTLLLVLAFLYACNSSLYNSQPSPILPGARTQVIPLTLPSSSNAPISTVQVSLPAVKEKISHPGDRSVSESTRTKSNSPTRTNTDLAAFLLDSSSTPNTSDRFQLHVVGDCHIVLRPPRWFTMLRRAPALSFTVKRYEKTIKHEFSTLFDNVYALKLPREDAYGSLNVSVSTVKKPKLNETFQVAFGTPWLKVASWKNAAQLVTEQVRDEFQTAQSGLSSAYEHTSTGIQAFMRDAVKRADGVLKEVEKIGSFSLNQTAKTTEIMVAQSKELSRTLSRHLNRSGSQATSRLAMRRQALRHDIQQYTQRMSVIFTQQASALTEAAIGLNVANLADEVQEYRETHFVEAQKKVLHAWWKLRGLPRGKLPVLERRKERRSKRRARGRGSRGRANR